MKISEIMISAPISIAPGESVRVAKRRMAEHSIRHLPVVDENGTLIGILTDRDIKLRQAVSDDPAFHDTASAGAVAVADPYTVAPDTPAGKVLRVMVDRHIGSALVVEDGMLLGIFTSMDACRVLADYIEQAGHAR